MSKNLTVSSVSYSAISAAAASVTPETTVVENPTATAEQAPYLPKIISEGKWDIDAQCEDAATCSTAPLKNRVSIGTR